MKHPIKRALFTTSITLGAVAMMGLQSCSDTEDPLSTNLPGMNDDVAGGDSGTESIAAIASANENFSTLVTALSEAKLVETLSGEGSFTVFAPTNDAFAALPEGTLESLLADPEGALKDILLYHVVGSKVDAAAVVELTEAETLNGAKVTIEVVDGKVILNGSAEVTTTDLMANNGIIHVIDAVILPPTEPAASEEPPKTKEPAQTIAAIASADENFSTLVTALSEAKLVETLSGEGSFTVFAPTNDAFAALPEGTLESLLADPEGALKDILLYHVVGSKVDAAAVVELTEAETLNGAKVTIEVVDGKVILNGSAEVTSTDIMANNGIIHVIDAVILPPEEPAQSIAAIASADTTFSTLVTALTEAKLVETLSNEGSYTVFAPTNAAFAALPEGTLESLLADPEGALKDVLLYHVVGSKVDSEAVVTLTEAETLNGAKVEIEVVDGKVILDGVATVTTVDIEASNGIIHVIDAVITP